MEKSLVKWVPGTITIIDTEVCLVTLIDFLSDCESFMFHQKSTDAR